MNSIVNRPYNPNYLHPASGGVVKTASHDRKRLWEYLPLPSTPNQFLCLLCNSWVVLKIMGPNGWHSPLLGNVIAVSSVSALVEFYETRRFVINRRPQVANIVKLVAATALLGYLNWQYFKLPKESTWIETSINARITAYMGRDDKALIRLINEPLCGRVHEMPREMQACFRKYLFAAAGRLSEYIERKELRELISLCFPDNLRSHECGWWPPNPLTWTHG